MATPVGDYIPLLSPDSSTLFDEYINGLVQGGAWTSSSQIAHVLTYSFNINDLTDPETGEPILDGGGNHVPGPGGTWGASPAIQTAVTQALAAWSSVADLTFNQVTSGTYYFQSTADLSFTLAGDDLGAALGLGFFPDPDYADAFVSGTPYETIYANPEGDVFFNNSNTAFTMLSPGGMGLTTILHEIGHALGLKHPGDDGANFRPTYDDPPPTGYGIPTYNSMQYTLMAEDIGLLTPGTQGFAATPMPLDILAIQHIYGANMTYNTGDNAYTLASDGVLKTIWDAGGTDTFNASGLAIAVTIDLNPGAFSLHGPAAGPYGNRTAIAYNVTIENATGGSGNDTITGNTAANILNGGAGADTMQGGAGNDTYVFDNAGDVATEGSGGGIDTVQVPFTYGVDQPGRLDLENITLTGASSINATGNHNPNVLTGNSAANVLHGHQGLDTLIGGAGNDTYIVWETGDVVIENSAAGADTVQASATYTLSPNIEDLALDTAAGGINGTGNSSGNVITGNASSNVLDGGAGADSLTGGAGNDTYVVDDAGDVVVEGAGPDIDGVRSFITYVLGPTLENLTLAGGGDINGTGNTSANRLAGNDGDNVLDGAAGADTMTGSGGDDIYIVDSPGDAVTEGSLSTVLASTASDGSQGNASSSLGFISDDGHVVAFQSFASNFAPGGIGTGQHIFVKNLVTGATTRVSSAADGTPANNSSYIPDLSADGRYVVFESFADNLVAGDSNGTYDIFVKDVQTGGLTRASTASNGAQGNGGSFRPDISADGRYVAFSSNATNLSGSDLTIFTDIFVKDLQTGATTLVSTASNGTQGNGSSGNTQGPDFSADGRYVVFQSEATNLVAGDTNGGPDLFRKDLQTGATVLVSSSSDGSFATLLSNPGLFQLNGSSLGGISGDGRYVAFNSIADNLVAGDTNGWTDVFVKDLQTGVTVRASTASGGIQANSGSNGSAISADGRYVLFDSVATNLAPEDTDAGFDAFIKDLQTGMTALVSAPATGVKVTGMGTGYSLSGDGRYVVFDSFASNVVEGDNNGQQDVFVAQNPLFDPGGSDEVRAGTGFTLDAHIERLVLTGTGNISGTGNGLNNLITGNSGSNALAGGAGNDTLDGGDGIDGASYAGAGSAVTVMLAILVAQNTFGAGTDTLLNIEDVEGSAFADSLAGDANANQLLGLAGNDTLTGGAGNDTLDGAAGTDWASYAAAPAVTVSLTISGAQNTVGSGTDTLVNIDNLAGSAFADTLTGDANANRLNGSNGNDTLAGGAGNDTLDGGADNDTLVVSSTGMLGDSRIVFVADVVIENAPGGVDTVRSTSSYTLSGDVENLVLTGPAFWRAYTGTGNEFGNAITGEGAARHRLFGMGGDDTLTGGSGADLLSGGAGADTLSGGTGSDVFLFDTAPSADTILDFASGTDHINLENAIFTAFVAPGTVDAQNVYQAPVVTDTSGDTNDYLKYATDTGHLYYDSNGSAAGGLSLIATVYSSGTTAAALAAGQDIVMV